MAWMQTISGKCVELRYPDPASIEIEEIAVSLSRLARFTGHTREFYSVAQHSLLVCQWLDSTGTGMESHPDRLLLAGLLHDTHEAYFGDISSPVKELLSSQFLGAVLWEFDRVLEEKFFGRGDTSELLVRHQSIHEADRVLLATERRDLMAASERPWSLKLPEPWSGMKIVPWTMEESERRFLERFRELSIALQRSGPC